MTTPSSAAPAPVHTNIKGIFGNRLPLPFLQNVYFDQSTKYSITNDMIKYSNFDYQQITYSAFPIGMTHLHIDIWTPDLNNIKFGFGNPNMSNLPTSTGQWNSFDINIASDFPSLNAYASTNLYLEVDYNLWNTGKTIYIDNLYFWSDSVPSVMFNPWVIPEQILNIHTSFQLSGPTSNSSGALSYTSGNSSVATIYGNTVSITGAGTTVITATQSADGNFNSGTISATLTVLSEPLAFVSKANTLGIFGSKVQLPFLQNVDLNQNFGQSTLYSLTNDVVKYSNLNYQPIVWTGFPIGMTHLHIDIWTPTALDINVKPNDQDNNYLLTLSAGEWNSFDIDIQSAFPGYALTGFSFFMLSAAGAGTIYVDNVYFWSDSAPSVMFNPWVIPEQILNIHTSFQLSGPTSNSSGALSYTSGNSSVATIYGNTVSITGAGTTVITATQSADGNFNSGTISATLTVLSEPLAFVSKANTLGIFGSKVQLPFLQNVNLNENFGQPTVYSLTNGMIKYSNFIYQPITWSGFPIGMTHLHIDIWTPTALDINVKPNDQDNNYLLTLSAGEWNSFDIDIQSAFPGYALTGFSFFMLSAAGAGTIYIDNLYFWSDPVITVMESLSAFSTVVGVSSNVQTITVTGTRLTTNITVTSSGVELSTDQHNFVTSLSLPGDSLSTPIYVRVPTTAAAGPFNGSISVSSSYATTRVLSVNGTVSYMATTSGDPYVTTFQGLQYKLPNIVRSYRLLEYPISTGTLFINASISGLSETEKIEISDDSEQDGFFYDQFFIGTHDSYAVLDRQLNLLRSHNLNNYTVTIQETPRTFHCPIQGSSLYVAKVIQVETVRVELRLFSNPQIRNGIQVEVIEPGKASGLLSSNQNPKQFAVKQIECVKTMNIGSGKAYNRVIKEYWARPSLV